MLMPKKDLVAIYEKLFSDGVMVAKKDVRPSVNHPQVTSVRNLHVVKALTSLKSRGYVREQFAWRHYYWFLTNEGIEYLRKYLHLPSEIVPSTLNRKPNLDIRGGPGPKGAGGAERETGNYADKFAYRKTPGDAPPEKPQ